MTTQPLGNVTAESDHAMLSRVFYETPDYLALRRSSDCCLIVGRRGTGKSALFYKLSKSWATEKNTIVVRIAPDDYNVIGVRQFLDKVSDKYTLLKACSKIFWKYAILMECALVLSSETKIEGIPGCDELTVHLREWRKHGSTFFGRLCAFLSHHLAKVEDAGALITQLVNKTAAETLHQELELALAHLKRKVKVLIDRLDEGYEPSIQCTALISGLANAIVIINSACESIDAYAFLRDNIVRAIAEEDPDYSRSFESRLLRLHWEEQSLFYFVCMRLRAAFHIADEKDQKVWDSVTAQALRNRSGFRQCLRLTLYRPRDLLVLLNQAFYRAHGLQRSHIDNSDIEFAAKEISDNRKRDLGKEYGEIIVGLDYYLNAFANDTTCLTFEQACGKIETLINSGAASPPAVQHYRIVGGAQEIVRDLYSIGFLGMKAQIGTSYVFSHDGRRAATDFVPDTSLLVHPCYWMSLNLQNVVFTEDAANEIHDDLDIEVTTDTTETRNKKIATLMGAYRCIPEGIQGASEFEDWCEKVIGILFVGGLDTVELHPNKNATQRRDVVGTNTEGTEFWKRVLTDYGSRHIIFEVKNFSRDLGVDEFRQMSSYLGSHYGRLGFIITRAESEDLRSGSELDCLQEFYHFDGAQKLIIKLTAKFLENLLSKQRSPQKFDSSDKKLAGLLTRYERNYIALGKKRRW